MAAIATVEIRTGGKLARMGILMAVGASRKAHLELGMFVLLDMASVARGRCVLPQQWISRLCMLNHAVSGLSKAILVMAHITVASRELLAKLT